MAPLQVVALLGEPEPTSSWSIRQIQLENGSKPVEEFLDGLPEDRADALDARMRILLNGAPFPSLSTLKHLRHVGNVWEVISPIDRILGFRDQAALVLTNGFPKKGKETPPKQIKRCQEIRDQYEHERPIREQAASQRNDRSGRRR